MSQYPPQQLNTEIIFVVEETPENSYTARALGYSIYTEADTLPELRLMVRDAVLCHFDETDKPSLIRLHFVKQELIVV
ncbi:2-oxoisovalerate dehydrogenase [Sphingobacteriales bacterium UPWRP_1]|nr:2-oxoisovalerate dehydrogenase [Sphingobacteriales bacterium UPWRP_1]